LAFSKQDLLTLAESMRSAKRDPEPEGDWNAAHDLAALALEAAATSVLTDLNPQRGNVPRTIVVEIFNRLKTNDTVSSSDYLMLGAYIVDLERAIAAK